MKKQHTLGPWVMDIEKLTTGHWNYKIVTEIKPLGNYPLHICTLNLFKDETHLKNAQLIAAAPEMFEMLQHVLNTWTPPEVETGIGCFPDTEEYSKIESILNKAKGEE